MIDIPCPAPRTVFDLRLLEVRAHIENENRYALSILGEVSFKHRIETARILAGNGKDEVVARDELAYRLFHDLEWPQVTIARFMLVDRDRVSLSITRHSGRLVLELLKAS